MTVAQPIPDHLALEVKGEGGIICVGDLHVGLESELGAKGVHVPSQTGRMLNELVSLSPGHDRLVLLGDIKNKVPGSTRQEHAELPKFLGALKRHYRHVDIVRGNHDTEMGDLVPDGVDVHPASGLRVGDVGFAHGHTWPSAEVMASRTLVTAHNHPTVALEDSLGNIIKEQCWLRFRLKERSYKRYLEVPEEIIMLPAFNRVLGGSPVNLRKTRLLGPLFSEGMADLENAEVYLADGIFLGTVGGLAISSDKPVRTAPKPRSHVH